MIYCIECERKLVNIESLEVSERGYHLLEAGESDWLSCYGPFTYSEPPNVPLQNTANLIVPDDEFMAISDANAESLLLEMQS